MGKIRIICTLGPASSSRGVLKKMILAGMDIARLNFSHSTWAQHQSNIDLIKRLNKECGCNIKILQDLEGYRIRVGEFKGGQAVQLKKRQIIFLTNQRLLGEANIIPIDFDGPLTQIKAGSFIYIDDGNIALLVKATTKHRIKTEVVIPGPLKANKGINIPDFNPSFKGITNKDKADLSFGIRNKVDLVAQSFVRNKDDINCLKNYIQAKCGRQKIIAKIENREGIRNIDEIIDASDAIMVARGDMGVSLPIYKVPILQKIIIKKCNQKKKPVITATQMLESMTEHIRPTRAEVSDIANAILDGSDYLMLSAETAVGRYPVESVQMMSDIIKFTAPFYQNTFKK